MEGNSTSWPELDSALRELGMLSTVTSSRKEYLREKLELQRHHHQAGIISGSPPVRIVERPLQPSQAWNVPDLTGATEGTSWGLSPTLSDNENNENTFRYDASLNIFVPIPSGGVNRGFSEINNDQITRSRSHMSDNRYVRLARLPTAVATTHKQHHLKPYNIPWRREERVRTKSENADSEPQEHDKLAAEVTVLLPTPPTTLFRSRSLEDVRSPPEDHEELDEMSREIQRLHVNE